MSNSSLNRVGEHPRSDNCTIFICDGCHLWLRPINLPNRPLGSYVLFRLGADLHDVVRVEQLEGDFHWRVFVAPPGMRGFDKGGADVTIDGVLYMRLRCRMCTGQVIRRASDGKLFGSATDATLDDLDVIVD